MHRSHQWNSRTDPLIQNIPNPLWWWHPRTQKLGSGFNDPDLVDSPLKRCHGGRTFHTSKEQRTDPIINPHKQYTVHPKGPKCLKYKRDYRTTESSYDLFFHFLIFRSLIILKGIERDKICEYRKRTNFPGSSQRLVGKNIRNLPKKCVLMRYFNAKTVSY